MTPFLIAKKLNQTINAESISFCAEYGILNSDSDSFFCGYYIKGVDVSFMVPYGNSDTFFTLMAVGKVKKHILNLPSNIKYVVYERIFKKNSRQIRRISVKKLIKLLNH